LAATLLFTTNGISVFAEEIGEEIGEQIEDIADDTDINVLNDDISVQSEVQTIYEIDGVTYDTTKADAHGTYLGTDCYFFYKDTGNNILIINGTQTEEIDKSIYVRCGNYAPPEGTEDTINSINSLKQGKYDVYADYNANGYSQKMFFSAIDTWQDRRYTYKINNFRQIESVTFLSNADWSGVTDMSGAFYDCRNLKTINWNNLDISDITNMNLTFFWCDALVSITFPNVNITNLADTTNMFYACEALESIDFSNCSISNITTMDYMFYDCLKLKSVNLSTVDTSNVTSMEGMFNGCKVLKSIDLSTFDTSNVTDMGGMFYDCNALESIDLSTFDMSNVTNMGSMFNSCTALQYAIMPDNVSITNTKSAKNILGSFHRRLINFTINEFDL
jgi:surface protein